MLFLAEGSRLQGRTWLGPRSTQEAWNIWEALSTPGIGYVDIIEHNRALLLRPENDLSRRIQALSFDLDPSQERIPSLSTVSRAIVLVRDAANEPRLDDDFRRIIGVSDFLCIPLLSREEALGEIILDNAITGAPIEPRDIKLASLVGLIAGNAIATARMLRRITDMERLAAMGEMAAFLTHQLRNPLTAVGGFVEQMADPRASERRKKRNLRIIRSEIRRLEEIIFKIAHLLKVELKDVPPSDMRPILESVLSESGILLKKRRKAILLEVADDLPPVLCDPVYIGEAIRNLLDNALDATPEDGTVIIRACRQGPGGGLTLSIQDSGPGIPESIRDKIFVPFFTTKTKGIGLGLVFVKRVMDACGGRVEVESPEGQGALFKLHFSAERRG
jgi:signal transduction histidine kinase